MLSAEVRPDWFWASSWPVLGSEPQCWRNMPTFSVTFAATPCASPSSCWTSWDWGAVRCLPPRWAQKLSVQLDSGTYGVADLNRLPGRHPHIALVPQWDFLNVIADASRREPGYELIMEAEATDLLWDGPRIVGVTYSQDGQIHRLEADLVVGCDEAIFRGARAGWAAVADIWRSHGCVVVPAAAPCNRSRGSLAASRDQPDDHD